MSLDYGWAWCRGAGNNEDVPSPESDRLNAHEHADFLRAVFHQVLPFILLYVGIPHVTKEAIPLILMRWRIRDAAGPTLFPMLAEELAKRNMTMDELMDFYVGYSTNATWKTDAEFWKQARDDSRASQLILTEQTKRHIYRDIDELRDTRRAAAVAT